jgi:phospholipid/cholesterol/gamma-HCH transport system substrate-binding protein
MQNEVDQRFRNLKKKVVVFAAVAISVVAVVVLYIGRENDLFTQQYELRFTVDKGTGFTRGMPVKLSGFRIGRVRSISLNEAAKVDVVLQIGTAYQKWIRKDSTAKLVKEGLVGDAIVEIAAGTPSQAMLQDRDALSYVKTKALDEMADEIAEKVKPVLIEVSNIISYVNDPKGDIKQSMRNINQLSKNLETTRLRADSLLVQAGGEVGSVSKKLSAVLDKTGTSVDSASRNLAGVLNDTQLTVKKANASLTLIDEKLPGLLSHAEASLNNVEKISYDLKKAEESALPKVPALVQKTDSALRGTNSVLDAAKGIWPLSGRIPEPREKQFVPGDSHD